MKEISGAAAFRLHDSLGLDLNLINKLAQCFNIKVDVDSLQELLLQQQQTSRVTVGKYLLFLTYSYFIYNYL